MARSKGYNANMTKNETFRDQLRRAIREAEVSRYQLWKQTGVAQSVLSRFLSDPAVGLSMDAVDRLVEALELELRPRPAKRMKKREG